MPYKKIVIILSMLVLCFSFCGCSMQSAAPTVAPTPAPTVAPLSKQYNTAGELVADIVNLNDFNKALNALSKNASLHHFFSQNEIDNKIWKLLKDQGYSYENIYCMYAVCNSNHWFDALNINGQPFAVYGAKTQYVSSAIPSKDQIINQIKNKFKDPYSVSIPGDMLLFPPTLTNEQSVMFPTPLEFAMWVGVRATNSFGAYLIEGVWLKVSNGTVTFYDSIAVDSEPKDCSLRGFEDTIIRITE